MIASARFRPAVATVAIVALVAVLAALALLALLVVVGPAAAKPTRTPGAAVPIEPRNETVAKDDALALLSRLVLPPGATRSEREPAGDAGTLAHAFTGPPATPNAIDYHAWWVVPESPASVIQYIEAHPPRVAGPGFRARAAGVASRASAPPDSPGRRSPGH